MQYICKTRWHGIAVVLAALLAPATPRAFAAPEVEYEPGGYLHFDVRAFPDDTGDAYDEELLLRRLRPSLKGTVNEHYGFKLLLDVAGGTLQVLDAHIDIAYLAEATLRVGKMKVPVGLERLQSATNLLFIEVALPTLLVPNRDIGIELHGDIASGILSYSLGVFDGVADGASTDRNGDDNFELAARVFSHPFRASGPRLLSGLGLGISGTIGRRQGSAGATGVSSFRTSGGARFFQYAATDQDVVVAAGRHARVSAQGYYYAGPVGLLGEYVYSQQRLGLGDVRQRAGNRAWQIAASFVPTLEKASYKGVVPASPFDPFLGQWGAVELAARYSALTVDDQVFSAGLADPGSSARKAQAWAVGINWYLDTFIKAQLDFERTTFSFTGAGSLPAENAILGRIQLAL